MDTIKGSSLPGGAGRRFAKSTRTSGIPANRPGPTVCPNPHPQLCGKRPLLRVLTIGKSGLVVK